MPDKQIIDLPALDELKDTDYLVVGRPSAPEPAQKMQGTQLVAFVNRSAQPHVTEAAKQAQAAAASAQTATTKASEASQSATQAQNAQQGAATAQAAAKAAQGKAEAAQTAAESAKAGAETAKAAAKTAQGKAEQALTGATDAKTAAETAQGKAETAKTEAESAKAAAELALRGANSSAQKANQAKEAAETAKAEAQKSQQAIENMGVSVESLPPETPPEVAKSIVQGVVNLLFKIPQGRTGQKGDIGPPGVSIDRIEKTHGDGSPGTKDTYTIYLDDGTSYPFQVLNGPQGPQGNGLTIKFTYDTLGELEAAVPVPELGMNAYIGTTQPYDVYSYTQTDSGNRWVNGGKLQGPEGSPGADGISPTVEVTPIENGHQVTITDKMGPKTFTVKNGENGANGATGPAGTDGVSPTMSVSQIPGGHQVSITDATGSKVFNVMDGQDGATGPAGANATINGVNALTLNVTGGLNGQQSGNTYTISGANLATKSVFRTVTLTAAGWSNNAQTVTVPGVVASETAQLITPTPAIASQSAYYEAGIMCTNQAANSLTFTCQTVPTSNLTVYVVIQPLS